MKPEEIAALVAEIDVKLSDPNLLDYDGLGGDDDPALALLAKARFVSDEALIARGHAAAERIAKNDHPFMSIPARPDRDVDLILSDLATRLREVLAERDEWKRKATLSGVCELAAENPNVMSYCREWEGRATKAEAAGAAKDAEIARLNGERDRYHDALIARHGGEPVALLSELDEARAERDTLRRELAEAREKAAQKCDAIAARIREDEQRAHSRIVNNPRAVERRGQSVELPLVRRASEIAVQRMVAEQCAAAIRALSTPAAKEGSEA